MKFLKSYENTTIDRILDKIGNSGMESLSEYEKDFLNKFSKDEPVQDVQKEMYAKTFTDNIGPYEAILKLYDITPSSLDDNLEGDYMNMRGIDDYSKWNGKLTVNGVEYDGQILFQGDDYLSGYFSNDKSDIFTDLEGLEHEVDSFLSWGFYDAIGMNESLLLEGRIEDLEERFKKKIDPKIVDYFKKKDRTPNKAYFEWLCDRYSKSDKTDGIEVTMAKMVSKYHRIKNKIEEKQISRIKTVEDLAKILNQDRNWDNLKEKDGVDVLYDSYEWIIFVPYTEDISGEFGDKAWCTVYDPKKHFSKHFGQDGALIYCMNKLDSNKNFAIEQTDYENGEKKGHVWDHKDERPITDEFLKSLISQMCRFHYLEEDTELLDVWEDIVEKIPEPDMTEAMLKPALEYMMKSRGVEFVAKTFGTYVIFETLDVSDDYNNIEEYINNKLKESITKNPRKYIEDEGVLYWTIMDNFPNESEDIMESLPWEDREHLIPIDIYEELGLEKVLSIFPNDSRREELIDLYIERNYGSGGNIEAKIENIWNIDVNNTLDIEELNKIISDNIDWKELSDSIYHSADFDDILDILKEEGVYNG